MRIEKRDLMGLGGDLMKLNNIKITNYRCFKEKRGREYFVNAENGDIKEIWVWKS